jgi:hypothetical protein
VRERERETEGGRKKVRYIKGKKNIRRIYSHDTGKKQRHFLFFCVPIIIAYIEVFLHEQER